MGFRIPHYVNPEVMITSLQCSFFSFLHPTHNSPLAIYCVCEGAPVDLFKDAFDSVYL